MVKNSMEQTILRERARRLSQVTVNHETHAEQRIPMIGFYLTPEQYCLEFSLVREVLVLKELTVIPGVPSFIQGIINVRGQVMSLMNLRKFLEIKESGLTEQNKIIIVQHRGVEIGILVDRVSGMLSVAEKEIDGALPNFGGRGAEFIKGITPQGVIVIDFAALLESKKILVKDL
jgi:purine-binding chemotaxis protein CheW